LLTAKRFLWVSARQRCSGPKIKQGGKLKRSPRAIVLLKNL
jgi:hypothetical protein